MTQKECEDLIDALVGMATITRPLIQETDTKTELWQKNIQHGICDLLEDAAVAIDELMKGKKMRNGHMQKLVNEYLVVMTEGDVEVCHRYVTDEAEAKKLVEGWKNGTLRLLTET